MSELKVYGFHGLGDYLFQGTERDQPSDETCHYYLKSEADKVINELKAQKAQAEDDCAYWKTMSRKCADDNEVMARQRAEAFKRERHHKYKRCLDMAKLCNEKWLVHNFAEIPTKLGFYDRWEKRWLELAEKFKETK